MNVYDLIYVQLQLSLFSNEPGSQYSERELSGDQTLCWIQKKTTMHTDFWNQNIPLRKTLNINLWTLLISSIVDKQRKQYMYLFTGMVLDELTDCETQAWWSHSEVSFAPVPRLSMY